ncbi:hypothetical protein V6N13_139837 [Hibiscus sabdariffa]
MCFQHCSGLQINFAKSGVYAIGVVKEVVEEIPGVLGCVIGVFPFTYLGLPVGVDPHGRSMWEPLVFHVRLRGGSYLADLPLGGAEMKLKMCRVGWCTVSKPKRLGRLGVVDLRLRNLSLLVKWAWRYATEGDSLWKSLIMAKYGSIVHSWHWQTSWSRCMSTVWRQIV